MPKPSSDTASTSRQTKKDSVAFVAVDSVVVSDLTLANDVFLTAPTHDESPDAVLWASESRLIVLDHATTGTTLRSIDVDSAGAMTWNGSSQISTVPVVRSSTLTLAGRSDGVVYVADLGSNVVRAFDANSLASLPASDVTLVESPLSVWIEDGEVRWLDGARTLHVGDATVRARCSSGSTELRCAQHWGDPGRRRLAHAEVVDVGDASPLTRVCPLTQRRRPAHEARDRGDVRRR